MTRHRTLCGRAAVLLGLMAVTSVAAAAQKHTPLDMLGTSLSGSAPCTANCSDHEEGYLWAEARKVDDPDDCDGETSGFNEGCRAYAEGRQAETKGKKTDDDE